MEKFKKDVAIYLLDMDEVEMVGTSGETLCVLTQGVQKYDFAWSNLKKYSKFFGIQKLKERLKGTIQGEED